MDVQWSEQGMQDDGDAHLEGYIGTGASDYYDEPDESIATDQGPLDRVMQLAGVDSVIEDDEDDEEPIEEAQSEAQKAAFQKMLDTKNGKKEETTEETETDEDEDEVSETLDRVKHLAGV
jgi:hypothetical protein